MIRCWVYIVRVPTCSELIVLFKSKREYLVKDGAKDSLAGSSVCGILATLSYWRFNSPLLSPRQSQETNKTNNSFLFYDARFGRSYSMYNGVYLLSHQFRGLESWMCVLCVQRQVSRMSRFNQIPHQHEEQRRDGHTKTHEKVVTNRLQYKTHVDFV